MIIDENTFEKLRAKGLPGYSWGRRGLVVLDEIRNVFGYGIPPDICEFIMNYGNVVLGPFSINITGGEGGVMGCILETKALSFSLDPGLGSVMKILDHAGESYFYVFDDKLIKSFDSLNIACGCETGVFEDLSGLINFAFNEAMLM